MNLSRRNLLEQVGATFVTAYCFPALAQSGKPTQINVYNIGEPSTLQTAINTAGPVQFVSAKIHSGLLNYDGSFSKPVPELAVRWDVSPDGKKITFNLRQNVVWHDGKSFSSEDVKFTLENVIKRYHSRGRVTFANLERVEAADLHTVILHLSAPAPYMMTALHASETPIVPKHIYENTDILGNPANNAPVGTGPYRFKDWKRGSYIRLERNKDYFASSDVKVDQVIFSNITDAGARAVAFESGELDVGAHWPVSMTDMQRFKAEKKFAITTSGYSAFNGMTFLEFNLQNDIFNDVRVRKAISHCIDRSFIVDAIYHGYARAATGPISSEMPGGYYSNDVSIYRHDTVAAEKLLDEAGRKRGPDGVRFSFTLEPAPWADRFQQMAEYVAQALARVGVRVQIRQQDAATFLRRGFTAREAQAILYGTYNMMDPTVGVQRQYISSAIGVIFGNGSGYSNSEIDALFAKAQSENDAGVRRKIFSDVQRIITRDVPNVPLVEEQYATLYNRRVEGLEVPLLGLYDNFTKVSVVN